MLNATSGQPPLQQVSAFALPTPVAPTPDTATPTPASPMSPPPEAYRQGHLEPAQVQFQSAPANPAAANASLQDALGYLMPYTSNSAEDAPAVPAAARPALDNLAKTLGFPNFQRLQHACRNLPREVLVGWYSNLPPHVALPQQREALKNALTQALQARFQSLDIPPPELKLAEPGLEWAPAALLAVYNSLAEMQEQVPAHKLKTLLTQANGKPLIYEMHPPIVSRSGELIRALGESMKVARRDQDGGKIILHQGAVFPDPHTFVKTPQISQLLAQIEAARLNPEQPSPAVAELQAFLNLAQPADAQLKSGVYDAATRHAVDRFRTVVEARQIRDIIADDRNMPADEKNRLLQSLDARIGHLFSDSAGYLPERQPADLRNSLLTGERWHKRWFPMLSSGSQERIAAVLEAMKMTQDPGKFDAPLLEKVTQFWFGMIDGGDNQDFTEQVLTHETGHILQNAPEVLENWKRISWPETAETSAEYGLDHTLKTGKEKGFVSPYATLSPEEDFAESYRTFVYQPERLVRDSLTKFLFMAAVTGRYEGKEQELLDFVKAQGKSNVELVQEMARFRGYLPQLWRDVAQQGGEMLADMANWLIEKSPIILPPFSRSWLDKNADKLRDVIPIWAQSVAENQSPHFSSRFASFLSGLDCQLQLNFQRFRCQPHEEGYALEALAHWQKIAQDERQEPLTRAHAEAELQRFAEGGVAFFSPEIQSKLPIEVKTLLSGESGPSNRALLVLLAKMVALGEENQCASDQRTDPLYAKLSPAAQALLEDTAFRGRVADCFGQTRINTSNLQKEVLAEIARLSQSNSGDFLRKQIQSLRILLQSERNLNNAYRLYQQTVERFNAGQPGDPLQLLSLDDFMQVFREKIHNLRPSPEALQDMLGLRDPFSPAEKGNPFEGLKFKPVLEEGFKKGADEKTIG